MADDVIAQAILRSESSPGNDPITTENVANFRARKEIVDSAVNELQDLGLSVLLIGPTSITISASKDVFERVFDTTLEARADSTMRSKGVDATSPYYKATREIKVPRQLAAVIAEIAIPSPPEFFSGEGRHAAD
jgi:hypothetical protein